MTTDTFRVLIVDDSEAIGKIATRALGAYGLQTHISSSFPSTKTLSDFSPHLVLLDIELEGAERTHLDKHDIETIRSIQSDEHALVFWYSGGDENVLFQKTATTGADGYINKTDGIEHMVTTVLNALEVRYNVSLQQPRKPNEPL